MADKKISELTNITGANIADGDELVVVDTSASETKAITFGEFKNALDTATGFVSITGDTMTGDLALSGADITFGDNDKAIFGAGSDLQIYHDGTNSFIDEAGTGNLRIRASSALNLQTRNTADTAWVNSIIADDGAGVRLFTNGSKKLETTSTGVDITGTLTSDGLTVDGTGTFNNNVGVVVSGATPTIRITETDTTNENTQFIQAGGTFRIRTASDDYSTTTERMRIDHGTGDISFYEDTGTTAKLTWSAADEELQLASGVALELNGWTITESGGSLYFATGGTNKMKLDASGNLQVVGNVEANATIS